MNTKRSKYAPGRLRVVFFDDVGSRIHQETLESDSFTDAVMHAEKQVAEDKAASFAIIRVIYNSRTSMRWEKKNDI